MPSLIVTPERMADTWLGALAWADGNQMCRGNSPAFRPKPNSASQNSGASSGRSCHGPRAQLPVCAAQIVKKAKSASMATCDAPR